MSPSESVVAAALDVDQQSFRAAMASFASGVTVVTTVDREDARDVGFTASAFSSLSLDPPLVLVCLDRGAESHSSFTVAGAMGISILAEDQVELALRFASRGADKFTGGTAAGSLTGTQLVDRALVRLECTVEELLPGGDHTIIVGRVLSADVADGPRPMLHFNRQFGSFQVE